MFAKNSEEKIKGTNTRNNRQYLKLFFVKKIIRGVTKINAYNEVLVINEKREITVIIKKHKLIKGRSRIKEKTRIDHSAKLSPKNK